MFSVIIPTRDRPQYLRQAIESVMAQSCKPLEIIVVNDGNGTVEAPASYPMAIVDNERSGPVAARHRGIQAAKGPVVAFLDDDDLWSSPRHLALAAGRFQTGASFTFSDGTLMFESGDGDARSPIPYALDANAGTLERDNTILISAVCYRRELHDSLGGFDAALPYYWDWDWYLRVARAGVALSHIAVPTVTIRVHQANMSGESARAERQRNLELLARKHGLAVPPLKNHLSLAHERRG